MKNASDGRENAQPEWPRVASAISELAANSGETQSFPDTRGTGILSDPWEGPRESVNDHDPDEVTVQLGDVGEQVEDRLARQTKGGPDGSDGPVFVDESGRRSRRYRRIGTAVGIACAVYAVVIVATLLSGNSNAPWLPVPGQSADRPADSVDTSPRPADSREPSAAAGAPPRIAPTAADGTTPRPGTGSAAPGASARPDRPGTSAAPSPTDTRATSDPGTGAVDPSPDPTPTQGSPSPDPSTSTGGSSSSPDPSPSGGGVDPGPGPVANGAMKPTPIAESPAGEPGTSVSPSSLFPEPVL